MAADGRRPLLGCCPGRRWWVRGSWFRLRTAETLLLSHRLRDLIVVAVRRWPRPAGDVVVGGSFGAEEFGFATGPPGGAATRDKWACCILDIVSSRGLVAGHAGTVKPKVRKLYFGGEGPRACGTSSVPAAQEVREYFLPVSFPLDHRAVGRRWRRSTP